MKSVFRFLSFLILCLMPFLGVTHSLTSMANEPNGMTKLICEEVKLTRDLYNGLLEQWDIRKFQKMASNKHRILNQLLKYLGENKNDPKSIRPARGSYQNVGLKKMYHELSSKGAKDTTEAVNVLLEAEEILLYDLQDIKPTIEDPRLIDLFDKIEKQTEKHIEQLKKMHTKNRSSFAFSY